MQEAVWKIQKLGVPPEGFEDGGCPGTDGFPSDETLDLWDEYQDAVVAISQPVTWEEAEALIKCCPTDRMAGVEWSLLHCIESCVSNRDLLETPGELEKYKNLIKKCNSDMMKEMLLERLDSYLLMETTKQFENEIAPFYWAEGGTGASVCLSEVGEYLQEIFDTRADEGFIGNGYDWGSLAQVFLDEKCPKLQEKINFDPEAGMFCAYSEDKEALADFILCFKRACEDRNLILDLFSRAELD